MITFGQYRIDDIPKRRQFERMDIESLVKLALVRKSRKHSFKQALVDYLMKAMKGVE